MLTSFDGAKFGLKKTPFIGMWLNFAFLGLTGLFLDKRLSLDGVFNAWDFALFSAATGLALGIWVKYRTEFSVKFSLNLAYYFLFIGPIIFGATCSILASDISGAGDSAEIFVVLYLASIISPFAFSLSRSLAEIRNLRKIGRDDWKAPYRKFVDFNSYRIQPTPGNGDGDSDKLKSAGWVAGSLAVNIPLLFQIFTGSKNNVMLIAMPMIVGVFAYLSLKKIGPGIATLYTLRQYEKQTNRRFINADYEKIQELRRTFFLSRWLMKDYCPAASQ
ncbi:hypothetical protein ACS7SF_25555 (plasmid) [Ralstonia sp. 25C]|uniref:hypothetical protein n=1 Tax=Ralstonia sp. 25C TaxID=3447363 RepID=UPI003F74BA99